MKCPKCGLLNPEHPQRCDCGFDFATNTQREAFLREKKGKAFPLPAEIRTFVIALISINLLISFASLIFQNFERTGGCLLVSLLLWGFYVLLVRKTAWASWALIATTFPIGLLLLRYRKSVDHYIRVGNYIINTPNNQINIDKP